MLRKIIRINEAKCTGCGECIPNCPEGALQIIDGKARLVSELTCDGLGACLGHCPEGAMTIEEREAVPYSETEVIKIMLPQGANTMLAHLKHLRDHGATAFLKEALAELSHAGQTEVLERFKAKEVKPDTECHGCPGAAAQTIVRDSQVHENTKPSTNISPSAWNLRNWPVQLKLVPIAAEYLKNAEVVIAADCAAFASPEIHQRWLQQKVTLIACPKLDEAQFYTEKLAAMIKENQFRSIEILHMEVPCCSGLIQILKLALERSGSRVPLAAHKIAIDGRALESRYFE
jgi:NAD-dependent dihydropyrimidine dehydrogenase PreA subunit